MYIYIYIFTYKLDKIRKERIQGKLNYMIKVNRMVEAAVGYRYASLRGYV